MWNLEEIQDAKVFALSQQIHGNGSSREPGKLHSTISLFFKRIASN